MSRKDFNDPFKGEKGVFHFSMDHLENRLLFKNADDFRYGVNSLALSVACVGLVQLLCYCLMGNHFHLLLAGELADCLLLYDRYLWKLSRMVAKRDGVGGVLKRQSVDIQAIEDTKQMLRCVAYILRNPYKARIASPFSYPWSSMDAYFNPRPISGICVESLPVVEVRKLFHSKISPPGGYEISDGVVLNRCFVDYKIVEGRFVDSVNFFDTLRVYDLESAFNLSAGIHEKLKFTDSELYEKIQMICRNEYHSESKDQLDRKTLLSLARTTARRFGAGKPQLGRLLGLPADVLDSIL